jgi:TPR repeat protein
VTQEKKADTTGCDSGESAEQCFSRGLKLQRGTDVKMDRKAAQFLFEDSCDKGNSQACSAAGWGRVKGDGVTKDLAEGGRYFEKGCPTGEEHAIACNSRGFALLTGLGETPRDVDLARKVLLTACRGANGSACMTLNLFKALGLVMADPMPRPNLSCQQSIETLEGFCNMHKAPQECWLAAMMLTTGTCTDINRDRAKPLHAKANAQGASWPKP